MRSSDTGTNGELSTTFPQLNVVTCTIRLSVTRRRWNTHHGSPEQTFEHHTRRCRRARVNTASQLCTEKLAILDVDFGMYPRSPLLTAWSLVNGKGFVISWSYYYTLCVATGIVIEDTATFTLDMLVVVDTVSTFLVTMLPAQKLQQGTLDVFALRFCLAKHFTAREWSHGHGEAYEQTSAPRSTWCWWP